MDRGLALGPDAAVALDEAYMRLALDEARAAEAAGEVPVGAIVVSPQGDILGRGRNQVLRTCDPTGHAEIVAIRAAALALGNYRLLAPGGGCTLYCTLEPCAMCAGAILHARLSRMVFAARDPKAGACGSVLNVMNHPALNHRVIVMEGVLAEECGAMLTDFFRRRRAAQSSNSLRFAGAGTPIPGYGASATQIGTPDHQTSQGKDDPQ